MSRRKRQRQDSRPWDPRRQPIQELGPDHEDELDLEHQYARDLFEYEREMAQQQGQQR